MATSKCGHCGGTSWEVKLVEAQNANYKQNFVQCASCGVPVGVLDYFNIGSEMQNRKNEIAGVRSLILSLANDLKRAFQDLETLIQHK